MITCTSPVNVRDAASSQSHVIGELAKGDQVEKIGEDGGWIKIRYQDRKPGYTRIICRRKTAGKRKQKQKHRNRQIVLPNEKSETYHFGNAGEDQTD